MTDLATTHSIRIQAPVDDVWSALTTPTTIKRWFFGVDTETDWQVGGPLVHRGEWQGKPYEDKGTILRVEPPAALVHTHWSPASGLPDAPDNYQEVRWSLVERDGGTELTVQETNLPSEEAKAVSASSWETVLSNLKELVEGTPEPETP
jgi:uncharacterized protein YndB with AHSA1/START domain